MNRSVMILTLFCSVCVCGCADHTEPVLVYNPCELTSELSSVGIGMRMHEGEYHKPGPYFAWNSNPSEDCPSNPTIRTGDLKDKELYVTYPTLENPLETGVVTVPAGKLPVVVFAHANNDRVCSIFERYRNLHNHWASWGFVVVAVDGTDTNCNRGSRENIQLRSDAQIAALEEVLSWTEATFQGLTVDENHVFFSGHSRGGGASFVSAERYPLTRGVMTLQGVDLTSFGFGNEVLGDYPVLGISASDDKDLKYPHPDLMEDQLGGEYTWVTLFDAIHGYTADSVPLKDADDPQVEREVQQAGTFFFTTAFLDRHTDLSLDWPKEFTSAFLLDPHGAERVASEAYPPGAALRWRRDVEHIWVDTFENPSATENLLGGEVEVEGLEAQVVKTYRPDENPRTGRFSKASALRLKADEEGKYTTHMSEPVVLQNRWSIDARIKLGVDSELEALKLVVVTTEGEIELNALEFIGPMPLTKWYTQLRVPIEDDFPETIEVLALRFELKSGEVFVDDLRFTPPGELE